MGGPYKLWDPVDLESGEEILNLGRDPGACASFQVFWRHTKEFLSFWKEMEDSSRDVRQSKKRTGGR